jgi:hypothetical protein
MTDGGDAPAGGGEAAVVDLSQREIGRLSLRGATVQMADLSGLTIREGMLGAVMSGMPVGLTVNGFDVAALIWDEVVRRDPPRGLTRSGQLDDLREAWSVISERWGETEERAVGLGPDALDERVDGEWSFSETLRHLVFVTDSWIGRVVRREPQPYHPVDLPPSFIPASAIGLDTARAWSFDEIAAARRDRQRIVAGLLDELTQDGLARVCDRNEAFGFPPETVVPVLQCVQTLLGEEYAHHGYAVRDLAVIEAEGRSASR